MSAEETGAFQSILALLVEESGEVIISKKAVAELLSKPRGLVVEDLGNSFKLTVKDDDDTSTDG